MRSVTCRDANGDADGDADGDVKSQGVVSNASGDYLNHAKTSPCKADPCMQPGRMAIRPGCQREPTGDESTLNHRAAATKPAQFWDRQQPPD